MSRPISDPVFDIGRDLQRAYDEGYKQGRYDEKVETETSLPSGEQTHALRTETHTVRSDTISRQDAIEALIQEFYSNVDDYISEKQAVHAIDSLPSAQTDIKQAAKSLLDFIESCLGGESYLITPDGENLRTDWGYVADGLQLIHEWADRSRRGADVRGGQDD